MEKDIDVLLAETDEQIEKLKKLKEKQEEIKQLKSEILDVREEQKQKKRSITLPSIHITPRSRKIVATLVVCSLFMTSMFMLVTKVMAANPAINYALPDNGSLFADQQDGDGVAWTINVTDADSNLAWVKLYANDSGSWVEFYDSGALGGVAYYNASGTNVNWTESWATYWWNISADDGSTHDTTYRFTTAYQWGDIQMAVLDDSHDLNSAVILKNATGDYYLFYETGSPDSSIDVKVSDTGLNWSLESKSADINAGYGLSSCFTYGNRPYALFQAGSSQMYYANWDGSSWSAGSTLIPWVVTNYYAFHADCIYYNGIWNLLSGYSTGGLSYFRHFTGTFPTSWTNIATLTSGSQYSTVSYWFPSLAILDGTLYCTYKDTGCDLHWQIYDGASWTDKGAVGDDSLDFGGGTSVYYGCSMAKDPVTGQLVCVYINTSGDLVYRTTDNTTAWSESQLIMSKGSYDIRYPHIEYIDHRLVITISYNLRGNYNIYTISAPDYSGRISGLNYTLNRIQWPDANPGDTHVNSTVFSLKNIDDRDIKTIMWHFPDLGEITANSNFEVWTNMSGSWASIGICDASGNVSTLDISGEMAGGAEWIPGQTTWWKIEILAVGSVNEDIHSTDEDIYYKIGF